MGNFNPRTPVGCDEATMSARKSRRISIHAPQWGATDLVQIVTADEQFQSTHPSGVRLYVINKANEILEDFNPRTPVGCDVAAEMITGAR